jgi:predicted O-methyltransferase YrrM
MNNSKEYNIVKFIEFKLIKELDEIIKKTGELMEGNCLYEHHRNFIFRYDNNIENLRYNIFTLCKNRQSVLEVGFNGGHSVALYMYSNPNILIKSFDICEHKYSEKCANYIKEYSNNNFELIKGDSQQTLKSYKADMAFDIIHIDGGHHIGIAKNDLYECKKFSHKDTILIFDDTHCGWINHLLETEITNKLIKEVNYETLNLKVTKFHRIFYYNE